MHNKIKRLEELVEKVTGLLSQLEEENSILKQQMELLSSERGKASKKPSGARELEELKAKVKKKLLRICARIEKASELQPGLFEDETDE
ncbi:MAG TPA: hypothetical protein DCL44_06830 [Elusimicrobia bacterium]|nr:hypothetical protein [Elusimicrobiota bacterium]